MTGEELKSVLQPTTPNRYRWNVDVAKAYENLLWHYHKKVSESGRVYHDSIAVKEAMRAIACTEAKAHYSLLARRLSGRWRMGWMWRFSKERD